MKKGQNYSSEFKLRLALESIKGEKTLSQLAQENEIHPNMINNWKKRLLENGIELFDRGKKRKKENDHHEKQMGELHKTIGQLTVERDFLKKNTVRYTGKSRSYREEP